MSQETKRERIRRALARLGTTVKAHPELQSPQARSRLSQWLEDNMVMAKANRPGVFVRMTDELIDLIDRYVDRMAHEQPGTLPTRSDAIRVLVYKGLEAVGESPHRGTGGVRKT